MRNIIDYAENELERLDRKAFGPVDSLILSQLAYNYFTSLIPGLSGAEPVRIGDLLKAEYFDTMFHNVRDPESNKKLLFALAASPRFRDLRAGFYVDELNIGREEQFSAVTFFLDADTAYIAFRGTDATFTGWKEDFNMAFISPVPAQEDALRYVEAAASLFSGKLIIGGHSKGGNLAVYSAMKCAVQIQDRIISVYSHDGPGFKDNVFKSQEYLRINARIQKTLPQSSMIGMLLQNQENYMVVGSRRFGLMQHDPFSWSVENGGFRVLEQLSAGARYLNKTLSDWINDMSDEKREQFVDALYSVISSSKAKTYLEFGSEWQKNIPAMLSAAKNMDAETRELIFQTLKALAVLAVKNLPRPRREKQAKDSPGLAGTGNDT